MKNYTKNILLSLAITFSVAVYTQEENASHATKGFDTVALVQQMNNLGNASDASGLSFFPILAGANTIISLGLNPAILTTFAGTASGTSVATINSDLAAVATAIYSFSAGLNYVFNLPNAERLQGFYDTELANLISACGTAATDVNGYTGTASSPYIKNNIYYLLRSLSNLLVILQSQISEQITLLS